MRRETSKEDTDKESSQDYFAVSARFLENTKQAGRITKKTILITLRWPLGKMKQNMDYALLCVKPQGADAVGARFICDLRRFKGWCLR